MSNIIISAENISKSYFVGHNTPQANNDSTLRDIIARNLGDISRKTRDLINGKPIINGDQIEEFWALKDVSFDINSGERVGIIGRNGAGKSTILKILSRITEPTSGRIKIKGRIASLLEVGTGFHPELTGRENIYLNGAILGMSRLDIKKKFDEIVDFAEVEKFLDTPVKRYSSGMYVRLAFSVAAHLEPEILIVDEVLAVGDEQFQKKCLGKMESVGHDGRTILFVSHNMDAVQRLCSQAIILSNGNLISQGETKSSVRKYLDSIYKNKTEDVGIWKNNLPGPGVRSVTVMQSGIISDKIICGAPFKIIVELEINLDCSNLELGFGLTDENGRDILRLNNKHLGQSINWPSSGIFSVEINVPFINWIGGNEIYLGIYFGYVERKYFEMPCLLKLTLLKQFGLSSCEKLNYSTNQIYIDGVNFK